MMNYNLSYTNFWLCRHFTPFLPVFHPFLFRFTPTNLHFYYFPSAANKTKKRAGNKTGTEYKTYFSFWRQENRENTKLKEMDRKANIKFFKQSNALIQFADRSTLIRHHPANIAHTHIPLRIEVLITLLIISLKGGVHKLSLHKKGTKEYSRFTYVPRRRPLPLTLRCWPWCVPSLLANPTVFFFHIFCLFPEIS